LNKTVFSKPLLWAVLGLYIVVAGYAMFHHEFWGDELQAWNIAKGSSSFFDVIHNTRYEGHPPVWYIILWIISKFTHNLIYVQAVHLLIAILIVFTILFYSPLLTITKILLPFGYYFLFEYAILSRNYAIGVLAAFLICIIINKKFRYKPVVYYTLLFIMSNTHLFAMLLAGSLHLYFLMSNVEKKKITSLFLHISLGILVFLPAVYFIYPPSDATADMKVLFGYWDIRQLSIAVQSPFRAFIPVPAWWKYNFWNTQFLFELHSTYKASKIIDPLVSFGIIGLAYYILRKNKKSTLLFTANLAATFIVGNIYVLTPQRYCGFIFIGFVAAYWLYCYENPVEKTKAAIVNVILFFELLAGVFMIYKDINLPFSNGYKAKELVNKISPGEKVITDYLTFNTISSSIEVPFYCVDIQKKVPFLLWGSYHQMFITPNRYSAGFTYFFQKEGIKTVYLISTLSPSLLVKVDSKLFLSFNIQLVDKVEGAIEKESNLYLYKISMQ
jgi:hypothetical protein